MTDFEATVRALPFWQGIKSVVPLHGGVSNAAFVVEDQQGRFVARIGQDYPFHQVERRREAEAHRAGFAAGLSPEMIYAQGGVMIVRHLVAKTYAEADVRADWQSCLDLVCRCHAGMAQRIRGQAAMFWVFQILRDYAETLRAAKHRESGNLPHWLDIAGALEAAQMPLPVIFGHHDLLAGNFLHDGNRLWLIDWEYGAFGTAMFDLANLAAANGLSKSAEQDMLTAYFGKAPDLATHRAYAAMKVAAALREALWGMVSELYLAAPGVDYAAYAAEHIQRFRNFHADYQKDFR